jgi:3D (Asp-Asp-Asp) domain-containing protein/peptidoglycan hydrolase CwlO-like protein
VPGPIPSLWALATALGTAVLLLSPPASGGGPSTSQLRQREAALAAKARSAVLGLYALDSRLDRARATLTALQARAAELRGERASARLQLAVAERAFRVSQRRLVDHLRVLYEQDEVDPIAIVLGAGSLEEAMTGIEGLDHLAMQNEAVMAQTRNARRQLTMLSTSLAERQAELKRLYASADATATALEQAHAERLAYLGRLRGERRLTAEQIATLDVRAQAAEATATSVTLLNSSPPVTPPPAPVPDTSSTASVQTPGPAPAAGRTINVLATGYSLAGHTATGLPVGWGVVAVDPSLIPLGTRLTIPGYGEGVAADTGGAVRGSTIDLWFPSIVQALAWGRRTLTIILH